MCDAFVQVISPLDGSPGFGHPAVVTAEFFLAIIPLGDFPAFHRILELAQQFKELEQRVIFGDFPAEFGHVPVQIHQHCFILSRKHDLKQGIFANPHLLPVKQSVELIYDEMVSPVVLDEIDDIVSPGFAAGKQQPGLIANTFGQ